MYVSHWILLLYWMVVNKNMTPYRLCIIVNLFIVLHAIKIVLLWEMPAVMRHFCSMTQRSIVYCQLLVSKSSVQDIFLTVCNAQEIIDWLKGSKQMKEKVQKSAKYNIVCHHKLSSLLMVWHRRERFIGLRNLSSHKSYCYFLLFLSLCWKRLNELLYWHY